MAPQDRDEIPFTVVVVGLCVLAAPCGLKAKRTKTNMELLNINAQPDNTI
jgi:hypothetical protein